LVGRRGGGSGEYTERNGGWCGGGCKGWVFTRLFRYMGCLVMGRFGRRSRWGVCVSGLIWGSSGFSARGETRGVGSCTGSTWCDRVMGGMVYGVAAEQGVSRVVVAAGVWVGHSTVRRPG